MARGMVALAHGRDKIPDRDGGGGMTAGVGVRGGTAGLRFGEKSQLQGSEGSSWS
jgi:DNA relaxase NicK